MIALDIETSGGDKERCGIWQIGAVDLITLDEFLGECRIDDNEIIEFKAMEVHGKDEDYLRDYGKQSQIDLLMEFYSWVNQSREMSDFLCQGPDMDVGFIGVKLRKHGIKNFEQRSFDLHTTAQNKYHELYGKYLIRGGKSAMSLGRIMKFCGFSKDPRKKHNGLEDAKIIGECYTRIIKKRNLFPKYSKIKIPGYLKK